ncbi:MAG: hypothetical protein KC586_05275 [Myxococcales bacterium]|nr:hypothetical protein [Myxococcales bacterium]
MVGELPRQPGSAWPARRDALRIHKRGPQRESASGARMRLELADAPPGTSVATPPSRLGGAFRWSGLAAATGGGSTRAAPVLTVWLDQGDEHWSLLEKKVPLSLGEVLERPLPAGETAEVAGRALAYWSPDGRRVVVVLEVDLRPGGDGAPRYRGWFLRSAGPQIRVVEAGSGQRRAREVALRLDAAGLPVAEVALREPPVASSALVLPRGREGLGPLAERIRGVLPRLPEPERQRVRHWADALVVLGQDEAD